MSNYYYSHILASTYGSNQYNTGVYNGSAASSSSGASGGLTNTGIAVAGIVTVAAVILLSAMAVRIWRRPSKKAQTIPVEVDDSTGSADK